MALFAICGDGGGCRLQGVYRPCPLPAQGLSQGKREIPPLRYAVVHQLKQDFPHLTIAINGGFITSEQVHQELPHVDGVMVGRGYRNPWWLSRWDAEFWFCGGGYVA